MALGRIGSQGSSGQETAFNARIQAIIILLRTGKIKVPAKVA
jgi:hypothetical protein